MYAWHQKSIMGEEFLYNIFICDSLQFSNHWHEEIELVYVLEGNIGVGVNSEIYYLSKGSMAFIGRGDTHCFLSKNQRNKMIVIQFGISLFEKFSKIISNRRFINTVLYKYNINNTENNTQDTRERIERIILALLDEKERKQEGYELVVRARLFDLMVMILREIPMETFIYDEKLKQFNRLERLNDVYRFIDKNYYKKNITVDMAAKVANFSKYYFPRFFKESTGMTFSQYLNNCKIKKAELYLLETNSSITEIAFKVGFSSIKTFNRIFKKLIGCSPSNYKKKAMNENVMANPDQNIGNFVL